MYNTNNYLDSGTVHSDTSHLSGFTQRYSGIKGIIAVILLPVFGLFIGLYLDLIALKTNQSFRKTLAYLIAVFAVLEFYWLHMTALLSITVFGLGLIFAGSYLYLRKYNLAHNSIKSIFSLINAYLDMMGQKKLNVQRQTNNAQVTLEDIDNLSGDEFENYMIDILNHIGYHHVVHTPYSNDFGLDAVGLDKNNHRVGWQFKHYNQGDVGYRAVEETMSGGAYYHTDRNYLLTNTDNITANVKKSITKINNNYGRNVITLINRDSLFRMLFM